MGISIKLYRYDYATLRSTLVQEGAEDCELLDRILNSCGVRCGDEFFLVNNEYGDGYSPMYSISEVLDSAFPRLKERRPDGRYWLGSFDIIIETRENTKKSWVAAEEVAEELGIELLPDDEGDDD